MQFTEETVKPAVDSILAVLGEPETDTEKQALQAFKDGDYLGVDLVAVGNLNSHFARSLTYLGSAMKFTPGTAKILSEAARAAADHARERIQARLSSDIEASLKGQK